MRWFVVACLLPLACGAERPKSPHDDGVPANSLSEARLKGEDKPKATATPVVADHGTDPTQPLLTPVTAGSGAAPAGSPTTARSPVSKQECAQLFDRYIDLAIGTDGRLEGLPPEVIAQAKAEAKKQKGDPCQTENVSRAKYTCAMAAQTTGDWQRCMK